MDDLNEQINALAERVNAAELQYESLKQDLAMLMEERGRFKEMAAQFHRITRTAYEQLSAGNVDVAANMMHQITAMDI